MAGTNYSSGFGLGFQQTPVGYSPQGIPYEQGYNPTLGQNQNTTGVGAMSSQSSAQNTPNAGGQMAPSDYSQLPSWMQSYSQNIAAKGYQGPQDMFRASQVNQYGGVFNGYGAQTAQNPYFLNASYYNPQTYNPFGHTETHSEDPLYGNFGGAQNQPQGRGGFSASQPSVYQAQYSPWTGNNVGYGQFNQNPVGGVDYSHNKGIYSQIPGGYSTFGGSGGFIY